MAYQYTQAAESTSHLKSATPTSYPTPYGSGDPYYNESSGYIAPPQAGAKKGGVSNWVKFGVPIAIIVIVAAVVGGVLGSKAHNNGSASSAAAVTGAAAASSAASAKEDVGVFATGTNSLYMLPLYPSTTNSAAFSTPTFQAQASGLSWPTETFTPSSPAPTSVRPDRPRIIAPKYKWDALPTLIQNEPYLKYWNDSIFANATEYYNQPVVPYFLDSGNGILDVARQIKMRIKAFSYAYRMSNNTKWVDRAYKELQNAAGNLTGSSFGPDNSTRWNPIHFLDTAEMVNAYAIAYDWMYDAWLDEQKANIMWTMITYGLDAGLAAYETGDPLYYGWWNKQTQGNWNCVCNGGLTLGALAIIGDDPTGTAEQILGYTVPNALLNCAQGPSSDGTWQETPNYWYFGVTGMAEMISALMTATGSDYDMLTTNPGVELTGQFHMHVTGPASMFEWGDNGVNLYSTNANAMLFYGSVFNHPEYQLFQRDQHDAPEPWSMFWYEPSVSGAFWDGLPLDAFFTNHTDQWASMRSSWTDESALYVAMKAGTLQGHQTHNDLDCGDFVLDALGTRWAGELGDENYLVTGYFSNDEQDSQRWLYYRKRTEGQNAILVGGANQLVTAQPTITNGTDGIKQTGGTTVFDVPDGSTAFFTADLASAYANVTSYQRGIRTLNSRKQVLLQDDITASAGIQWRMHTNATVTKNSNGFSLQIGNEKLEMTILSPSTGYTLSTQTPASGLSTDPPPPEGQADLPNTGVTVIMIDLPAGEYSLQVLFSPQWPDLSSSDYTTSPPSVSVSEWSLTSHGENGASN
ncbi:chondroitin AC/alginate lyase [Rhodofomes roseus]|uniref:Chondroitin AC/alginate lyase n=1 Tax=Rhodofomes roseus TaxID=34475 RepID=A0ABQ8KGI1_9APHY|nr:chondroitin AC/alginate lyase [Rhodofomes roseus]KAH9836964.1 chondroitin AC/alginate lyase [Rhodofomes roseus]